MPPRRELCRNFQRGSCKYGDRCKFLHATSQQSNTNPFGFGVQSSNPFQWTNQQQHKPNPFGFGAQNNAQSRGGNEVGSKPNQLKPFENKWVRSNNSSGSNSRQPDNQPQAAIHKCTDPKSCKRAMVQDLENEKPLWKLTCYAHDVFGPCDVVGDISCEELRALAYADAKNGKGLQFIVERERSLLASKLAEFQNLLQKPYVISSTASTHNPFGVTIPNASTASTHNPFGVTNSNAPIQNGGISAPNSNFSQLNAYLNTSSAAAPNYTFVQSTSFQNNNNTSHPSSMFQMNHSPSSNSGVFGQLPQQSFQNSFSFGSARPSNNPQTNPFTTLANSSQTGNMFDKPFDLAPGGTNSPSNATGHSSISPPLTSNMPMDNTNAGNGIWAKAKWKWNAGEIPEDAPPDIYIH